MCARMHAVHINVMSHWMNVIQEKVATLNEDIQMLENEAEASNKMVVEAQEETNAAKHEMKVRNTLVEASWWKQEKNSLK